MDWIVEGDHAYGDDVQDLVDHDAEIGIPGWRQVEQNPECGICSKDGPPTPFCPIHGRKKESNA